MGLFDFFRIHGTHDKLSSRELKQALLLRKIINKEISEEFIGHLAENIYNLSLSRSNKYTYTVSQMCKIQQENVLSNLFNDRLREQLVVLNSIIETIRNLYENYNSISEFDSQKTILNILNEASKKLNQST